MRRVKLILAVAAAVAVMMVAATPAMALDIDVDGSVGNIGGGVSGLNVGGFGGGSNLGSASGLTLVNANVGDIDLGGSGLSIS